MRVADDLGAVRGKRNAVGSAESAGTCQSGGAGERVGLYVARKSESLTQDDLIAHCRTQLTAYKVPREVRFLPELPKSNVGKILRRELRDRMTASSTGH